MTRYSERQRDPEREAKREPEPEPDRDLDARDLLCPLPVLKARKVLLGMAPGQVLRVLATDRVSIIDMPHFCAQAGHDYLGATDVAGVLTHRIRRGVAEAD